MTTEPAGPRPGLSEPPAAARQAAAPAGQRTDAGPAPPRVEPLLPRGGARVTALAPAPRQTPQAGKMPARLTPFPPAPPFGPMPRPQEPHSAPFRPRHRAAWTGFVLGVLLPVALLALYLWGVVRDQYASVAAFSVRQEQPTAPLEAFGGMIGLGSGSSSDSDILHDFILSPEMVARINAQMDLRGLYAAGRPDPLFALAADATAEDLRDHWRRVVHLGYDQAAGLLTLRVLAFDPAQAQWVTAAILDESTRVINDMSAAARAEATRAAEEELARARDRLAGARIALTRFRAERRLVDPEADLASQTGVLDRLNADLAEAMVERDLLLRSTGASDPRILLRDDRIRVIETRIAAEKAKFGGGAGDLVDLVGEFERLTLERDFAQQAYVAALAARDAAVAEAGRQRRYLAVHVRPTLAERPEYPRRWLWIALAAGLSSLVWAVLVLAAWPDGGRGRRA